MNDEKKNNLFEELMNSLESKKEVIQEEIKSWQSKLETENQTKAQLNEQLAEIRQKLSDTEMRIAEIEQNLRKLITLADIAGIQVIGYTPSQPKKAVVRKAGKKLRDPKTGKEYLTYADACRQNNIDFGMASAHAVWVRKMGYDLTEVE